MDWLQVLLLKQIQRLLEVQSKVDKTEPLLASPHMDKELGKVQQRREENPKP